MPLEVRTRVFILLISAGSMLVGCEREEENSAPSATVQARPTGKKAAPEKTSWTAEEIAKDPQGYIVWSGKQIDRQIQERQARLEKVSQRQAELAERQKALQSNLDAIANIRTRLEQAYRRAEDEDRWPVKMGGRSFERDKAKQILADTAQYLEDRQPLAADYQAAVKSMSDTGARLKKDIEDLKRLRQRLDLDLDRLRLRQGMEELNELRKTEAELATMSKMLSESDQSTDLSMLAEPPKVQTMDVETLLK